MDDKFRLVFAWSGSTPTAHDYLGPEALVFTTLRDAVEHGQANVEPDSSFFIAYKYLVFEPPIIDVIYQEFCSKGPVG